MSYNVLIFLRTTYSLAAYCGIKKNHVQINHSQMCNFMILTITEAQTSEMLTS